MTYYLQSSKNVPVFSDFTGNSRARKLIKAQTKRANTTGVGYNILPVFVILFFLLFWSGLRDSTACSLLGLQYQNSGYGVTRLFPFLLRIMCYVFPSTDVSGPPSLPPLIFPCTDLLSLQCNLPACAYLSTPLAYSPSVCHLFAAPSPQYRRLPPAVRLYD